MFYVGQKVACVNARNLRKKVVAPLKQDARYTVREVIPEDEFGGVHLLLSEIVNGIAPTDRREYSYRATRFRPVVERKTDISIFTEILDRVNKRDRIPAS